MVRVANLSIQEPRGSQFKISLGKIARPCLKNKQTRKTGSLIWLEEREGQDATQTRNVPYGELVVSFSKAGNLGTGPIQQGDGFGWIPPSHMAFFLWSNHLRATEKNSDPNWFSGHRVRSGSPFSGSFSSSTTTFPPILLDRGRRWEVGMGPQKKAESFFFFFRS